jgi:hypothetical protein
LNKIFKAEKKELVARFGNYEFGTQVEVIIGFDISKLEQMDIRLSDFKVHVLKNLKDAGFNCEITDIKIEVGFECWSEAQYHM